MLIAPDSSVCIEWFSDGPAAEQYAALWNQPQSLLISAVVIYEVSRWFLARNAEELGQNAVAALSQCRTADLTPAIARHAALLAATHKLGMADAIILATVHAHDAELWTQDADFAGLPRVRLFPKLA